MLIEEVDNSGESGIIKTQSLSRYVNLSEMKGVLLVISLCRFKEIYHDDNLPSIINSVSKNSILEKDKVVRYMKSFKPNSSALGSATDVFTGKRIDVPLTCFDDGKYSWRSDILYYFEKYNLRLLDEFVDYVISKA